MALPRAVEAIVVGGGPAGSATAWALARNGIETLILDRAHFPRSKPCAEYLSPQAGRILDEMGVLGELERVGARLAGMRVHAGAGPTFEGRFVARHGFRAYRESGLAVRRETLDARLLACARGAGAQVAEGVAVQQIVRGPDGAVAGVTVREGDKHTTISARHVVGADGLRSVVARRLGLARRFAWPERYAFVAHYAGVRGVGDCGEMHVFNEGYCGIADVGGGVTNVAVVVTAAGAKAAGGDAAAFMDRWIAARPTLVPRFSGAGRVSAVQATGPFASRARRASRAGASLVGDAADFYDPFTGEGIYAALRGAELLAPYVVESLRARDAHRAAHALAAYDRCRRHEFSGKWQLERLVAIAVAQPRIMARIAHRLDERRDLADLLVGVTGDFIPSRHVLNLAFAWRLFAPAFAVPGRATQPA